MPKADAGPAPALRPQSPEEGRREELAQECRLAGATGTPESSRLTSEPPPDDLPSFQTVPEELQNGRGFGYVVAFRPHGTATWMLTVLASADACRYVFRNESVRPFSPFEVRVGVYNNKGEGPFSPVSVVYSAEEGRPLRRWSLRAGRESVSPCSLVPEAQPGFGKG